MRRASRAQDEHPFALRRDRQRPTDLAARPDRLVRTRRHTLPAPNTCLVHDLYLGRPAPPQSRSVGQTRTHARQATQASASMTKFTARPPWVGRDTSILFGTDLSNVKSVTARKFEHLPLQPECECLDFPVQCPLADAQDLRPPAGGSPGLLQRRLDCRLLHFSHCHARAVQHVRRCSVSGTRSCNGRDRRLRNFDDLDPRGPLVQPPAQLLHLEPESIRLRRMNSSSCPAAPAPRCWRATGSRVLRPPPGLRAGMSDGPDLGARAPAPPSTRSDSGAAARCPARAPPPAAPSPRGRCPGRGGRAACENSRMNRRTRSGMSSRRSRSGGR